MTMMDYDGLMMDYDGLMMDYDGLMMDYDGLTQQRWTNYWVGLLSASLCESILSKQPALKGESSDRVLSRSNQSSHATPTNQ